jgi:hypothetical protein
MFLGSVVGISVGFLFSILDHTGPARCRNRYFKCPCAYLKVIFWTLTGAVFL